MSNILEPSWDNVINSDRVELVFENRNKDFGAYVLRKGYTKTTSRALLISISIFTLCICAPVKIGRAHV